MVIPLWEQHCSRTLNVPCQPTTESSTDVTNKDTQNDEAVDEWDSVRLLNSGRPPCRREYSRPLFFSLNLTCDPLKYSLTTFQAVSSLLNLWPTLSFHNRSNLINNLSFLTLLRLFTSYEVVKVYCRCRYGNGWPDIWRRHREKGRHRHL